MTTKANNIVDPETIPSVAIDFMNATHHEEVEMVNILGELIVEYQQKEAPTDSESEVLTKELNKWFQHTQAHFARENELMLKIQFPMYSIHFGEHESVLASLNVMLETWKNSLNIKEIADYISIQWPVWFENHVNSMDMITAHFAVMNGFDPNSKDVK